MRKPGDMLTVCHEPKQAKTFEDACRETALKIAEVVISKQRDYGHGNINAFGEYGVLVRTSDKLERLKHLYKTNQKPVNESVDDSWLDLAGYSIIALMLRDGSFQLGLKDG